jgi:hypothetical protein
MMMYAAAGQCFCYIIITICIRYNELDSLSETTRRSWAEGSIAFFFLYYVFFGIGWQGVPWVCVPPGCCKRVADVQSSTRPRSTQWQCAQRALLWALPRIGSSISWVKHHSTVIKRAKLTAPASRRDHPSGNRLPALALLHHLGRFQLLFHPNWFESLPTTPTYTQTNTLPLVYFLYPETAGRSLEDIDRFFHGEAPLLVFRDKEAIASRRPEKYVQMEQEEIRRHSSVVAGDVAAANAAHRRKRDSEGTEYHDDV